MAEAAKKEMVNDIFVRGARKGWNLAVGSTVPNIVMAFVLIQILKLTGALDLIGTVFAPVMGLFGLPGEATAVLAGAWLSMGGAVGVVVGLFDSGILNGTHIAILAPAIYTFGSQAQYLARVLGVIGTDAKYLPVMTLFSVISGFIAMWIMLLFV